MLDADAAIAGLAGLGLADWSEALGKPIAARLDDRAHGDLPRWRAALEALPDVGRRRGLLAGDAVATGALDWSDAGRQTARAALLELIPWRKGPFEIGDIRIDSEWRSNLKWDRIAPHVSPLEGRLVLDAGCGNGYYALRMRGAGARGVLGADPTLVYLAQFAAVMHFLEPEPVHLLPLRLEELPRESEAFDTAFSMGVLYHSRAPVDHLRRLREALAPGGELVLETLVLPGDEAFSRTPAARYARMRNVWHLPTVPELLIWLHRSGFADARLVGVSETSVDEQRTTDWMPFDSLAAALDSAQPGLTVEGWPAPRRAVVIAGRPAPNS